MGLRVIDRGDLTDAEWERAEFQTRGLVARLGLAGTVNGEPDPKAEEVIRFFAYQDRRLHLERMLSVRVNERNGQLNRSIERETHDALQSARVHEAVVQFLGVAEPDRIDVEILRREVRMIEDQWEVWKE